jgi:outer membrane protein OmpA-like peptidoglycan-associated protein
MMKYFLRAPMLYNFFCFLLLLGSISQANIVGSDLQNFAPITSGLDFVTVQSANTLEPGVINVGAFLNYAVNTLPYFAGTNTQPKTIFNDSLLGVDFNLGMGLMRGWDIGVSMPSVVSQTVNSDQPHGQFEQVGVVEVRPNTKVRLLGNTETGLAAVLSMTLPMVQSSPFTGKENNPIYNLELAAHTTYEKVVLGINGGYRFRTPGTPIASQGISPFGDQYTGSLAASYLMSSIDTKIIGEIFGATPVRSTNFNTDRYASSLESLIGLKHDFTTNFSMHAGGGIGLMPGVADPDWRLYAGLNYSFGPLFSKRPVQQLKEPTRPDAPAELDNDSTDNLNLDPFDRTPQLPVETFIVKDILFKFNSDQLEAESKETLDKLARYLNKPPVFNKLLISGHTDSVGKAAYNLNLSQRRANSVKQYLVQADQIPETKVSATGYGLTMPIASNANYQGRALNRRVEFKIYRDSLLNATESVPNMDSSFKTIESEKTERKRQRSLPLKAKSKAKNLGVKKSKKLSKKSKKLKAKKVTEPLPEKYRRPRKKLSADPDSSPAQQ